MQRCKGGSGLVQEASKGSILIKTDVYKHLHEQRQNLVFSILADSDILAIVGIHVYWVNMIEFLWQSINFTS